MNARRRRLVAVAALALVAGAIAAGPAPAVVTNAADAQRTGWYPDQPALTHPLVTGSSFGRLFRAQLPLGDQVDAQPLVADDTLLVVTERNLVLGLDPRTGEDRWRRQLGSAVRTAESTRVGDAPGCDLPRGTTGITSTPVVDDVTHTMYLVSKRYVTGDGGAVTYEVHAMDVRTGVERAGFPVPLQGFAADNQPQLTFDARWELQRPGLLLLDGVVYAAFAGHCDRQAFAGWVVGVDTGGAITSRWAAVSAGPGAGIWQSGGGLVSDGPGRILLVTGNGRSPAAPIPGDRPPADLGQSVVRLQVGADRRLSAADFFTPYDAPLLDTRDVDFGSGGPVALPDLLGTPSHPHLMVAMGKQGIVYLLDRDDLGGVRQGVGGGNRVVQEAGPIGGVWSRPAVWPGDGGWLWVNTASGGGINWEGTEGRLEVLGVGRDPAGAPRLTTGEGTSDDAFSLDSGAPVVTSDGLADGTGIVWIQWGPTEGYGGQLRAYDAVPHGGRPRLLGSWPIGRAGKFQPPGVGDGRIYVAARGCLESQEPERCPRDTPPAVLGFGAPTTEPLAAGGLAFGGLTVGSDTVRTQSFSATRDVTVTSLASSDGRFVVQGTSRALPASLRAGETLSADVRFAPDQVGTVGASLAVHTETAGAADAAPVTVGLSGRGISATALLRPVLPLSFGGVVVGGHASRTIRLYNDGAVPLHVTGIADPAGPGGFRVPGLAAPFTIAAGGSALVTIDFEPAAAGRFEDELTLYSDGGDEVIALSGAAAAPPRVEVTPPAVAFGAVAPGQSATGTFTVTNAGGSPATISRSQPPTQGAFVALDALPEGTTLAPGAERVVRVRFAPSETVDYTDAWSLNADDDAGRRAITFTGTGRVADVRVGDDPLSAPLGPVLPVPAGPPDRVAPVLRAVAVRGGMVRAWLSEPARLDVTVARLSTGRRIGTRCLPATAARRRARACVRLVTAQHLVRSRPAGAARLALARRSAGRYRVTVRATDAAGNRARPTVVEDRVRPRRR